MKKLIFLFTAAFTSLAVQSQPDARLVKLADSLLEHKQLSPAFDLYQKAYKINPKNDKALRGLGFSYIQQNRLDSGKFFYEKALKVDPRCARCYMNLGRIEAIEGRPDEALRLIQTAIGLDPNDAALYAARGAIYENTQKPLDALMDYDKAIKLEPSNANYYLVRAEYNQRNRFVSLAIADASRGIELEPDRFEGYLSRGRFYGEINQWKEAMQDFKTAMDKDSTIPDIWLNVGESYARLGDFKSAIPYLDKCIEAQPEMPQAYYYRASCRNSLEDMDGSCGDLQRCRDILLRLDDPAYKAQLEFVTQNILSHCDSAKAGYYYQRGIAAYNLNRYEEALTFYQRGLEKFPNSPLTHQFTANAYLALNQYRKAYTHYQAVLANQGLISWETKENPRLTAQVSDFETGFLVSNYLGLARAAFGLGNYDSALSYVNKAMSFSGGFKGIGREEYYNLRGNIYLAKADYTQARGDFEQCISINPKYSPGYVNRAIIVLKQADRKHTIKAIGNYWTFPADARLKADQTALSQAMDDCNKAVFIDPNQAYAYYVRGYIRRLSNDPASCEDFRKAQSLQFVVEVDLLSECP